MLEHGKAKPLCKTDVGKMDRKGTIRRTASSFAAAGAPTAAAPLGSEVRLGALHLRKSWWTV